MNYRPKVSLSRVAGPATSKEYLNREKGLRGPVIGARSSECGKMHRTPTGPVIEVDERL